MLLTEYQRRETVQCITKKNHKSNKTNQGSLMLTMARATHRETPMALTLLSVGPSN